MRDLRILCLHGFRASASALRAQMRALVTGLDPGIDFLYVDAPALPTGGLGWWNAVQQVGLGASERHYEGWDRTREWAVSLFERSGPIDGVFGFSQGAALTALLVGLRRTPASVGPEAGLTFDFALMVGGFISNDPAHATLYEPSSRFALPSFHLLGRSDRIVPRQASLALAARFENPVVVEHDGGHVIAPDEDVRSAFAQFLIHRREETPG